MENKIARRRIGVAFLAAALLVFGLLFGLIACDSTGEKGEKGDKGESGANGKSVYQIYLDGLESGETPLTEAQWLDTLKGENGLSAYDVYKANTTDDPVKTEAQWLNSLKGAPGENGVLSITALRYVTVDKWNIQHKLEITYVDADSATQKKLTDSTVNVVDQNIFYEAADNDELWQLIDLHVRRIRLTDDVLWIGNKLIDHSQDRTPLAKYSSIVSLTDDVEIDIAGHEVVLEATGIDIGGNASVTFKNGSIKRINRITTTDETLYGKVLDSNLGEGAAAVEHKGRSVYVPSVYKDGKPVASDAELKNTAAYAHLPGTPNSGKVISTDTGSGAASAATLHVQNYCSLRLDTVDYFTLFTGIYVDGLSSSVEVVNNSVIDAEGTFGISTNAASSDKWNVVITVKDSTVNASHINTRHDIIPSEIVPATALMINVPGSVIVENSTLEATSQALIVRGGHAVARNSRIRAQSVYPYSRNSDESKNWGSSNKVPNAAVVVGNMSSSYQYEADCTLTNCEVKYNQFPYKYTSGWEIVYVLGNTGTDGKGHNADGEWIGATFTYDAMTFARSGKTDFHVENRNETTSNVYRPEMLLNANEWYEADTQRKISDLLDFGAKNIRLVKDLDLVSNTSVGENAGYTVIDRDLQFGLNGYKLTVTSKGVKILNNADVLFQNGTFVMNSTPKPTADMVYGDYAVSVGEFCTLSLEAVKMYTNRSAVFMDGKAATLNVTADSEINAGGFYGVGTNVDGTTDFGVIITIKYSKIVAGIANGVADANPQTDGSRYGVAVLLNVPGTLKVEKSSYLAGYTQGVILRDGTAIMENSTVEALGTNSVLDKYATVEQGGTHEAWGKGYNVPNAAIVVGTYNTSDGKGGYLYQGKTELVLRNMTVKKSSEADAKTAYVFIHNDGNETDDEPACVTFDTLTAMKTLGKDGYKTGELITKCASDHSKLEIWDERD